LVSQRTLNPFMEVQILLPKLVEYGGLSPSGYGTCFGNRKNGGSSPLSPINFYKENKAVYFTEWWFHDHNVWSTIIMPSWSSIYSIYEGNGWRFCTCILLAMIYAFIKDWISNAKRESK
jgi:hypothetical protein